MTEVSRRREGLREVVAAEYSRATVVVTVIGAVAAALGVLDSLRDADGDRLWGALPLAAPCVVAAWACLELIWRPSAQPLHVRLLVCCLVPAAVSAFLSGLVASVITTVPAAREVIEARAAANSGFHYWFGDAVGLATFPLHLFAGWGIGASIGLLCVTVVVLPTLAVRGSRALAAGTDLDPDLPESAARAVLVPFSFALSASVVGIVLCVWGSAAAQGGSLWEALQNAPRVFGDAYYLADAAWVTGVLMFGLAVVLTATAVRARAGTGVVTDGAARES